MGHYYAVYNEGSPRRKGTVKFPAEWPVSGSWKTQQIIAHELGHVFGAAILSRGVRTLTFGRVTRDCADFGNFTHGRVVHSTPSHPLMNAVITLLGPLAEEIYGGGPAGGWGWAGDQRNFKKYVAKAEDLPHVRVPGARSTPTEPIKCHYTFAGITQFTELPRPTWVTARGFASPDWAAHPERRRVAEDAYIIASTLASFMGPFIAKWGAYLAEHRTKYISAKQSTILRQMTADAKSLIPAWLKFAVGDAYFDASVDNVDEYINAALINLEEQN